MKPIVSVHEARRILGKDADRMSDDELQEVILTLDLLAKDALEMARKEIRMKSDAKDMANLIYDIYQDKKAMEKKDSSKPHEE